MVISYSPDRIGLRPHGHQPLRLFFTQRDEQAAGGLRIIEQSLDLLWNARIHHDAACHKVAIVMQSPRVGAGLRVLNGAREKLHGAGGDFRSEEHTSEL